MTSLTMRVRAVRADATVGVEGWIREVDSDLFLSDWLPVPRLSAVPCAQQSFVFAEMKGTKGNIEIDDWLSE